MNNMKRIQKFILKHKKSIIIYTVLCVLLTFSISVYAWFDLKKEIETVTMVQKPTMLVLTSGNIEDIERFNLGDIDVEESTSKEYVFGVYSDVKVDYKIELAYTQNIDFKSYEIYKAREHNSFLEGSVVYITESGEKLYYSKADPDPVDMAEYIDDQDLTYENYEYVQDKAVPKYYIQRDAVIHSLDADTDKGFIDYYILKIDWEGKNIQNDKETDMIYIIVSSDYTEKSNS